MSRRTLAPIAHSHAVRPEGSKAIDAPPDADERIQITAVLRARTPRDERRRAIEQLAAQRPSQRRYLSAPEFKDRQGSTSEDIAATVAHARESGLTVDEIAPERRCVVLSGRIGDVDSAFGVQSQLYAWKDRVHRSHEGPVQLPPNLGGIVVGVLGLDTHPATQGHAMTHEVFAFADREQVMEEYDFPEDADGTGERIGIVALGGGFHTEDVADALGARRAIRVVELGATNSPADRKTVAALWEYMRATWVGARPDPPDSAILAEAGRFQWTLEVTSDVENAARFAPGAEIVVYFAPDTMQGKYHAFTSALVDPEAPSVLSCSWGTAESSLAKNHAHIMDDVFSLAALRGITICCSSGDHGDGGLPAVKGGPRRPASAHFPASSPHVLACGGTMPKTGLGGVTGHPERVWYEELGPMLLASGGGVSVHFGPPWWQPSAAVPSKTNGHVGRGLPDVAGKADMRTGFRVTVGGCEIPVGGTSSVAPLWAALIARVNQKLGARLGFGTPLLYLDRERFASATTSVTEGNNGEYSACAGWNACTGWGTPRGQELLRALASEAS